MFSLMLRSSYTFCTRGRCAACASFSSDRLAAWLPRCPRGCRRAGAESEWMPRCPRGCGGAGVGPSASSLGIREAGGCLKRAGPRSERLDGGLRRGAAVLEGRPGSRRRGRWSRRVGPSLKEDPKRRPNPQPSCGYLVLICPINGSKFIRAGASIRPAIPSSKHEQPRAAFARMYACMHRGMYACMYAYVARSHAGPNLAFHGG